MISYFLLALIHPLSIHIFVEIPHRKWHKKNSNNCVVFLQKEYSVQLNIYCNMYCSIQNPEDFSRYMQLITGELVTTELRDIRKHLQLLKYFYQKVLHEQQTNAYLDVLLHWIGCIMNPFFFTSLLLFFQNSYSHKYWSWLVFVAITLKKINSNWFCLIWGCEK